MPFNQQPIRPWPGSGQAMTQGTQPYGTFQQQAAYPQRPQRPSPSGGLRPINAGFLPRPQQQFTPPSDQSGWTNEQRQAWQNRQQMLNRNGLPLDGPPQYGDVVFDRQQRQPAAPAAPTPTGGYQPAFGQPAQNGLSASPWGIQASITPQSMFDPGYMRQSQNLVGALGTPTFANYLQQAQMPGVSANSPAVQYRAGIGAGQAAGQGATLPMLLAQQQGWGNYQNQLQGQVARDREAQQWAGLGADQWGNQMSFDVGQQGNLMRFLGNMQNWWQ